MVALPPAIRTIPYLAALALSATTAAFILTRPAPFALGGDAVMLLHPLLADAAAQVRAGHLPLWTAGRWGGSPLIGDAVVGALYPPYHLAYALTPFPHWRALDVSLCLHVALLATGFVWWFRGLGVAGGAALASTIFLLLSPTFVYVGRNWHEYCAALAYWPWLFGAAARLAAAPRIGVGWIAVIALAAQVYAGYPEFGLFSGLAALGWIVIAPGPGRLRRMGVATVVGLAAVAAALPQVLPGLDMARGSIRLGPGGAERMAVLDRMGVPWSGWLAIPAPTRLPPFGPAKLAPATVVLALVGALDRRAVARWLALCALASALLASGPNVV